MKESARNYPFGRVINFILCLLFLLFSVGAVNAWQQDNRGPASWRRQANESAAVSSLRTINTAEVTYMVTYPEAGYARDLATLGSPGTSCATPNKTHACMLDSVLGNSQCVGDKWCVKYGYKFLVSATCPKQGPCTDYLVVATPTDPTTGTRNFCSTADAVVRSDAGGPLSKPISMKECQSWKPLS